MRAILLKSVCATVVLVASVFCFTRSGEVLSNPFETMEVLAEDTPNKYARWANDKYGLYCCGKGNVSPDCASLGDLPECPENFK